MQTRFQLVGLLVCAALWLNACQPQPAQPFATQQPQRATPPAPTAALSPSPRPSATLAASPTPLVPPEKLKGLQIQLWHPWSGAAASEVQKQVDDFNHINVWGIQVTVHAPGSLAQLMDQLHAQNSGSKPSVDLIAAPIDALKALQAAGNSPVALDALIGDAQWGLQPEQIADFYPAFLQQDQIDGKQMALPAQRDAALLIYNLTWAREMGFTQAPAQPADFEKQACTALQANVRLQRVDLMGTGGWILDNDPLTLLSWMGSFKAQAFSADGSPNFNAPESQQAFEFLQKLMGKTCAWPGRLPQPYEYFAKRMALFYSGSLADIQVQTSQLKHLKKSDQWALVPYPTLADKPQVLVAGPSYAILQSQPEREMAAWLVLRWLMMPNNQAGFVRQTGTLPLSHSATQLLDAYGRAYPQWKQALKWIDFAVPAPSSANWQTVSAILQDAGWQIFHQPPTPIALPTILQQVDDTLPEIVHFTPSVTLTATPKP